MATPLELSTDYPFSPQRFFEVYFDRGFTDHLNANLDVEMRIEILHDKPETYLRTVRTVPHIDLPGFAKKVLGGKKGFSYLETSKHDKGSDLISWNILPSVIPDKFSMGGVTRVVPTPNGCTRFVEASVEIKIFALGPRLEETIVKAVRDSFIKGQALMVDYEKNNRP